MWLQLLQGKSVLLNGRKNGLFIFKVGKYKTVYYYICIVTAFKAKY